MAARIDTIAKTLHRENAALLREAARRLKLREALAWRVRSIRQVSVERPAQWDGVLEDGDKFFVRYAGGDLTLHVDDTLCEYIEPELPHPDRITLDQVKSLLAQTLDFGKASPLALRKLVD